MASLQDQLLKSGLADTNSAKKTRKEKRKQVKTARKSNQAIVDESKLSAERILAMRAERDRALNIKRQEAVEKKAVAAQITQLIQTNKINRDDCDVSFSFVHHNKVKKIYVDQTLQSQLGLGYLAIVSLQDPKGFRYELVPTVVAKKIAERDPEAVIHLQLNTTDQDQEDENDPYSEFKIPDDLMW